MKEKDDDEKLVTECPANGHNTHNGSTGYECGSHLSKIRRPVYHRTLVINFRRILVASFNASVRLP